MEFTWQRNVLDYTDFAYRKVLEMEGELVAKEELSTIELEEKSDKEN